MAYSRWETISEKPPEGEPSVPLRLEDLFALPPPPEPEWEQVRTVLTEPRQMGLGEGLVTEVWMPPQEEPGPGESVEESEKEKRERAQQKKTGVPGLTRKFPALRYDGRHEGYFREVAEARRKARNALIDPYTDLACEFADVSAEAARWERLKRRAYAYAASANLQVGRLEITNWSLRAGEAAFLRAVKADAHDPEAWWHLGIVRLLRRRNKEAVEALRTACDYRPGDGRSRIALGLAHYHNCDYAAAEECFRYERGAEGRGVGARSFLICALRMQGKWEQARREIQALAQHPLAGWREMAGQCVRCVERGEGVRKPEKRRRPLLTAGKAAAVVGAVVAWVLYNLEEIRRLAEHFKKIDPKAFVLPAAWLVLALGQHLKRALKEKTSKELFGDGEEDLPCWQTRSWMRPHRLDIFGHPMEIPRR